MKKTKRIIAVVISVLMLVGAIPLTAFAATTVTDVDLSLDVQPGTRMENYEEYITVNSQGVEFCDDFGTTVAISEIYEEEFYWPSTEYFNYGCDYEIKVLLSAKDGYTLPAKEGQMNTVTVNGEEVFFEIVTEENLDGGETTVIVVYATVIMDKTISDVALTLAPVADYSIEDYYRYVSIDSLGVDFEETLDSGVIVTDSLGNDPYYYFIADEEYTFEICLTPAWGCEFAKDEEGNISLGEVTVNGEAVDYTAHIQKDRGYIEYIIITVKTVVEVKTVIDTIEITIAEDLKGCDVADYAEYLTIETEGVTIDEDDPYAIYAYNSNYDDVYTFDGGDIYILCMNFIAEEGYFFSPDGVVIKINGEEYYMTTYDSYENEDGVNVEYIYVEYVTDFVGGFFDMVIAWFNDIFSRITQFLFGWI